MEKVLCIIITLLINLGRLAGQENVDSQVYKVKHGLLPMNIFEGEKPYSLDERMKFYKVPGVSIAVIKNYELVWVKHYGLADEESKVPVTDNTLFNIGSLSKGVASLTFLSLVEKGKIALDDPVNNYLESWKIPENELTKNKTISPRLLMNHTSGVMHSYGTSYTRENFPTITQSLLGVAPSYEKPTVVDKIPGTVFQYSNPGFAILQQLTEDITKEPFYQYAQKNIFEVLEMKHTTFQQPLPEILEKEASRAHRKNSSPLPVKCYYTPNAAAGGLWTTVSDFAKYVIELQKSFHGQSNKIISRELAVEMLKTHVAPEYGLGLFIRKYKNEIYFSHMGDNAGFFAGFVSHLSDGNAIVVFSNSNTAPELIREITKAVAKVYQWRDFLPETLKPVDLSASELKKFSGRYRSGSDKLVEIDFKDGNLFFKSFGNEKLFHVGNNTFMIKRRIGQIKFDTDAKGAISHAEYSFADEIGRLPQEPEKLVKMKASEKIPYELLVEGKYKKAMKLYLDIYKNDHNDSVVGEMRLNSLGYRFVKEKDIDAALTVFKLNMTLYPSSANCYDSYAEALALAGKTDDAVINYRKALELDPKLENAKQMIKKLSNN